jgi:hypothetical protein
VEGFINKKMGENPIFLFDDLYRKEFQSTIGKGGARSQNTNGFTVATLFAPLFIKVDF